jgi:uncharacterized membrane protein YphA (DoxX/SURF4 family)
VPFCPAREFWDEIWCELTPFNATIIVRRELTERGDSGGKTALEHSTTILLAEAFLRVILGWRMLISGLSNVRRWPNPVNTASILFPRGAVFFGFVATFLMVVGGFGLAAGIQTPLSAVMIIIFLIPTFALHWHWLKVLPTMAPVVRTALKDDKAQSYFRSFDRQSYHAHEVGLRDNLVFLAAAVYFAVRGSAGFGVDNWLSDWVIWLV